MNKKQLLKSLISFKLRKFISLFLMLFIISSISFSFLFMQKLIALFLFFDFSWLLIRIKKSINKSLLILGISSSRIFLLFKKLIQSINIEIVIVRFSKALYMFFMKSLKGVNLNFMYLLKLSIIHNILQINFFMRVSEVRVYNIILISFIFLKYYSNVFLN